MKPRSVSLRSSAPQVSLSASMLIDTSRRSTDLYENDWLPPAVTSPVNLCALPSESGLISAVVSSARTAAGARKVDVKTKATRRILIFKRQHAHETARSPTEIARRQWYCCPMIDSHMFVLPQAVRSSPSCDGFRGCNMSSILIGERTEDARFPEVVDGNRIRAVMEDDFASERGQSTFSNPCLHR